MEDKQYRPRCSMAPLIYSIVPIGVVSFIGIVNFAFPRIFRLEGSDTWNLLPYIFRLEAGDTWNLLPFCIALIALVAVPMGIFSILSGMAEIRVPYGKGKTLVALGIVFGILDIAAGAGFLLYLFRAFSKFF